MSWPSSTLTLFSPSGLMTSEMTPHTRHDELRRRQSHSNSTPATKRTGDKRQKMPEESRPSETQPLLAEMPAPPERATFPRKLGTLSAFAVIISIVIGSGVFTSPGTVDANVPSPGVALLVWTAGGALAWTGAATLAELGAAIPGEGGVQPYLAHMYGEAFGFLAAWTWIVAVMPATLAILAIVFVDTLHSAVSGGSAAAAHGTAVYAWPKLLSVGVVALAGIANSISTQATTRLNSVFVGTKFASILAVAVAGAAVVGWQLAGPQRDDVGGRDWFTKSWWEYRDTVRQDGSRTDWSALSSWELMGHLSAALYGALWAYSGWDKAVYVSAELSAPARQLPLAINWAMPTVIFCFLLANTSYYVLLPWNVVSTTDSVAVTAMARLLGTAVSIMTAVLICLVVAGSLLGNSFVAGRIAVAAANKTWLPGFLGLLGHVGTSPPPAASQSGSDTSPDGQLPRCAANRSDAPINAIILSTALSAPYILLGDFRALLVFEGLGEYSFFFLIVVGAIILRYREPQLVRPYKPPVLVPAVFALASGFVVARGAMLAPLQAAMLILVWLAGVVVFRVRSGAAARRPDGAGASVRQ